MIDISIFFLIWIIIVISGGIINIIAIIIFYNFCTKKIILLLIEADLIEFANNFNNIICNVGKLRPYSFSKEGKSWDIVWRNFRKIIISNKNKKLIKFQNIAKIIHNFSIFYLLFFLSLPISIIVVIIIQKLI